MTQMPNTSLYPSAVQRQILCADFLDTQLSFLYIQPTPKRVLINYQSAIDKGDYAVILKKLTKLSREELMKVYTQRQQEPQENSGWVPKNPNFPEDTL